MNKRVRNQIITSRAKIQNLSPKIVTKTMTKTTNNQQQQCFDQLQPKKVNKSQNFNNHPSKDEAGRSNVFIQRLYGSLSFTRTDKQTKKELIGKIDTATRNNYILKDRTKNGELFKLKRSFIFNGFKITHFVRVNLFSHNLVFCVIDHIKNFDLILGAKGLKKMKAIIDIMSFKLTYKNTTHQNLMSKKPIIERSIKTKSNTLKSNGNIKAKTDMKHNKLARTHRSCQQNTISNQCQFPDILSRIKQTKYFHKRFLKVLTTA